LIAEINSGTASQDIYHEYHGIIINNYREHGKNIIPMINQLNW
jgi:hypothetical protein